MKFKDFQAPVLFSSTYTLQGLEFRRKKFKYFQGLSRMRGNPALYEFICLLFFTSFSVTLHKNTVKSIILHLGLLIFYWHP